MKKKLIIIIGAAVALIVIVAVALIFILGGKGEDKEEPIVYEEFPLHSAEEYSNLLVDEGERAVICKYAVVIKYSGGQETLDILTKNTTELKNNVDEIMRCTRNEDVKKQNGKEKLRGRIQNMVMDTLELDEEKIADVFLQPFVVQD